MSPAFFHDYSPSIAHEVIVVDGGNGLMAKVFRVHAVDADGEVIIGARSDDSFGEAYDRLCSFIDGELDRRAKGDR